MRKRLLMSSVLFLSASTFVMAATTGKIAGVVQDAGSGDALPGVNIILAGTSLGAAADADGNYFILNIPPGDYSLQVSAIGYEGQSMTDIRVNIDRTTTINFALQQAAVAGEEVVIISERPLVRHDVAYSQINLGAEVISAVPAIARLDDFLEVQVGVDQDRFGLTIRGNDGKDIAYYMDGMSLRNERMDRGFSQVSKTAIQEVQLTTGTFNAEYGNASAGLVQIVTKNPGNKYFVSLDARYSPLIGGSGDDPDYPGLKHFGPYVFSNNNWWEYGRYDWNEGAPAADKDGDGEADFEGWDKWALDNKFKGNELTAREAFEVWRWRARSEDQNGDILYNGVKFGTLEADYNKEHGDAEHTKDQPWTHDLPFNHYGYQGDRIVDLTIGGPIPGTAGRLGFVLSHLNESSIYPFATSNGSNLKYNTTQLKLVYNVTGKMTLMASGLFSDVVSFNNGDPEPRSGLDGGRLVGSTYNLSRRNDRIYGQDSRLVPKDILTRFLNLKLTHALSPRTFYEVKLSHFGVKYNQVGNEGIRNLGDLYQVGPVWLDESPKGWSYKDGDSKGILNLYSLRGERSADLSHTDTYSLGVDVVSQMTTHHQVKAGIDIVYKDIYELTGYAQFMRFYTSPDYIYADGVTARDRGPGDQANWHDVQVYSTSAAAYVQDKMEFGGMVLMVGLRLDYFKPHKDWFDRNDMFYPRGNNVWDRHYDRYGDNPETGECPQCPSEAEEKYENYYGLEPDTHPPAQLYLSPRFGISHPIGPQSKIFFNYGHFYDPPTHDYLYRIQLGIDEPLEELGNPWLKMPRTIQFEAGWEQSFLGSYVATVTGYYKDLTGGLYDGVEVEARASGGKDYDYVINGRGKDTRGLEITVRKPFGDWVTGFINAEFRRSVRLDYGLDNIWHPESSQYRDDPLTIDYLRAVESPFQNQRAPGRWLAKANVAFHTPGNYGPGPVIAGTKLLGGLDLSFLHRFQQGASFNWNPDGLENLQGLFNRQVKAYNRTDFHLGKRISVGGADMTFFMDITNLFNVKNVNRVFGSIGQGDFNDMTSRQDKGGAKTKFRAYMDAIEDEDKRFGDETDDLNLMPQRIHTFYEEPQDIWIGFQFNF